MKEAVFYTRSLFRRILPVLLLGMVAGGSSWALWSANRDLKADFPDPLRGASQLRIVPNLGQWQSPIRYGISLNQGRVWLQDRAVVYSLVGSENGPKRENSSSNVMLEGHTFRVNFVGAQENVQLTPAQPYAAKHHYYQGEQPDHWASGVPLYGQLDYQSLYPGIDLRFYGVGDHLKYDFLVAPGADPSAIALDYEGVSPRLNEDGALVIETAVRTITELAPVAYQVIDGGQQPIRCEYRLEGQTLRYHLPDGHDPAFPLVIDPEVVFSTYSGAVFKNEGYAVTHDESGFVYAAGTYVGFAGDTGYPRTPGAFQRSAAGGPEDVVISKYSPDGSTLIYSTFLGGSYTDFPISVAVNPQNELYVMGRTRSTDFPMGSATPSAQSTHGGNGTEDLFVVRFSPDGKRLLSGTFLGGGQPDGLNFGNTYGDTRYNFGDESRGKLAIAGDGSVWLTSCAKSIDILSRLGLQRNIPQNGLQNGTQAAVVIKLTPDLSAAPYGTFISGKNGSSAGYDLKIGPQNRVYVCGGTTSSDLLTYNKTAATGQQTTLGGGVDGFVACIEDGLDRFVGLTYLGTGAYDQAFLLDLDRESNVHVLGQTLGNWPVQRSAAAAGIYQNPSAKQFLVSLSPELDTRRFSTVLGSSQDSFPGLVPTAFGLDTKGRIYLAGWGGSENAAYGSANQGTLQGFPVQNPIRGQTDGNDFYCMVLEREASALLHGGYFGDPSRPDFVNAGGAGFDQWGNLYLIATACNQNASNFPTTPGVFSPSKGGADCNMAVAKLALNPDGAAQGPGPGIFLIEDGNSLPLDRDTLVRVCVGEPVLLTSPLGSQAQWRWSSGGGTPASSGSLSPAFSYSQAGRYTVNLIVSWEGYQIGPNEALQGVTWEDTASVVVQVETAPVIVGLDADPDPDDPLQWRLEANIQGDYDSLRWTPSQGLNDPTSPTPTAELTDSSFTYQLTVYHRCGEDEGSITLKPTSLFRAPVQALSLYPNPATDQTQLRFSTAEPRTWALHDLRGRTLRRGQSQQATIRLDLGDLSPGLYGLTVQAGSQRYRGKLLLR